MTRQKEKERDKEKKKSNKASSQYYNRKHIGCVRKQYKWTKIVAYLIDVKKKIKMFFIEK